MASITFCGAAGTVTGSCNHVTTAHGDFLVDCGLFQGSRTTRELNDKPFPFSPEAVEFVLLTHAHIDHSGLLPKLSRMGFTGKIYATAPTVDLLEFMLLDSAYIQQSNADRVNRTRRREGLPEIEPAYTTQDAEAVLKLLTRVDYEQWVEPKPGIEFRLWNAGHLLGSASAEVKFVDKQTHNMMRLLFSGDLGPDEKVFHPEPDAPEGFDYIVCESTYGNRERADYTLVERRAALKKELNMGLAKGGNVIIPSFAVERSQELLHDIGVLLNEGELENATVYLDSPLARKATEVFVRYASSMEDVAMDEAKLFKHERFRIVQSVDESKAINDVKRGAIIISASGMCNAGRIKHHLKNNIWRKEATILFVGYQSPGTLGQIITSGARRVTIHGRQCQVNAAIRRIGNYSAHADQSELLAWVAERGPVVGGLFLNHGEDTAREELKRILVERGIKEDSIFLPQFDEKFELIAGSAQSKGRVADRIEDTSLEHDWYNDYAAFILELANRLEHMPDGKQRAALIKQLDSTLDKG